MLNIIIDGSLISNQKALFPPFRERFDDLYGSNLNALHDVISYNRYGDFIVIIKNQEILKNNLGLDYYNEFLSILKGNKVKYIFE